MRQSFTKKLHMKWITAVNPQTGKIRSDDLFVLYLIKELESLAHNIMVTGGSVGVTIHPLVIHSG